MGRPRTEVEARVCRACGATLERKTYRTALEGRKEYAARVYCNRSCMASGMQKDRCTPKHSRVKASRSAGPACDACGRVGRLHVHHQNEDPSDNSPQNLRTLCGSCHKKSHSPNYAGASLTRVSCSLCEKPSYRKGLCCTHLSRLKRHGDPLTVLLARKSGGPGE